MRKPSAREWLLIALVPALIVVGLGAENGGVSPAAVIAEARPADASSGHADRTALDLALRQPPREARAPADLFASKSWYVPPPPPPPRPPAPVAPPPPAAPPLPFTFLGRYVDAGAPVFFLVRDDRILAVRVGDVVEGSYRVDGVVGSRLTLTYLPLNIQQSLDIGSA